MVILRNNYNDENRTIIAMIRIFIIILRNNYND